MSSVRHRALTTLGPIVVWAASASLLAVSCAGDSSGPAWTGLFASEVTLDDGRVVTVDRAYLTRAVLEPDADRRAGSVLHMPATAIPATEIELIVDFLISLG